MGFEQEQMNIVIVGHVDHGKSTLIGRLLADTGSLPQGKLEQVKLYCERNAKPFEYAFLLDALKDEQAQGITIDAARCFFKSKKRHYIIFDAPGHIEFLKNMITGAARAEAALLVIAANEGVQENSRRHGFLLSFLGISQIVVLINKMDLVGFDEKVFERIKSEYLEFLREIKVEPQAFIPISAREGENIVAPSRRMPWYKGPCVLEMMDGFEKERPKEDQPFRLPIQDVYKFTEEGDDRRIIAGTVATGRLRVGEEIVFLPSGKKSVVKSIEGFNQPVRTEIGAGEATGVTLTTQVYVKPGEILCRAADASLPKVGTMFKANIFWLGRNPMIMGKKYKLKLGTNRSSVFLRRIINILDASDLTTETNKDHIDRYDVAECVLETVRPIAYDLFREIETTGRFVIVDHYEIAGGGIIIESVSQDRSVLDDHISRREYAWEKSSISAARRGARFHQKPKFILITGAEGSSQLELAKKLEEELFLEGRNVYFLGISNLLSGLNSDVGSGWEDREEQLRRLGELARIFTDAGLIFIANVPDLDEVEIEMLKVLNLPNEILVVDVGDNGLSGHAVALKVKPEDNIADNIKKIKKMLFEKEILIDYSI